MFNYLSSNHLMALGQLEANIRGHQLIRVALSSIARKALGPKHSRATDGALTAQHEA